MIVRTNGKVLIQYHGKWVEYSDPTAYDFLKHAVFTGRETPISWMGVDGKVHEMDLSLFHQAGDLIKIDSPLDVIVDGAVGSIEKANHFFGWYLDTLHQSVIVRSALEHAGEVLEAILWGIGG